jgi:hypothetical protein
MSDLPATQDSALDLMERVVVGGDIAKLSAGQRLEYYRKVCESLGLNPLTQPFQYISLQGKLTLYATRACTDQLRRLNGVSVAIVSRETVGDVYIVTAQATDKHGRKDEATGAVAIGNLKGDALANALMKAETKAKRRVTLSIVGLGWLDETEVETIPGAQAVTMDAPQVEAPRTQTEHTTDPITPSVMLTQWKAQRGWVEAQLEELGITAKEAQKLCNVPSLLALGDPQTAMNAVRLALAEAVGIGDPTPEQEVMI